MAFVPDLLIRELDYQLHHANGFYGTHQVLQMVIRYRIALQQPEIIEVAEFG